MPVDKIVAEQLAAALHMTPQEIAAIDFHVIKAKDGEVLGAVASHGQFSKENGGVTPMDSYLVNLSKDKTLKLEHYNQDGEKLAQITFRDKDGNVVPLSQETKADAELNVQGKEIGGVKKVNNPEPESLTVLPVFATAGVDGVNLASATSRPKTFDIEVIHSPLNKPNDPNSNKFAIVPHGNMELSVNDIKKKDSDVIIIDPEKKASVVLEIDKDFYQSFISGPIKSGSNTIINQSTKTQFVLNKDDNAELFLKYEGVVSPAFNSTDMLQSQARPDWSTETIDGKTNYLFYDVREKEGRLNEQVKDASGQPITWAKQSEQQGYTAQNDNNLKFTDNEKQKFSALEVEVKSESGGTINDAGRKALDEVKQLLAAGGDQLKHDADFKEKVDKIFGTTGTDIKKINAALDLK